MLRAPPLTFHWRWAVAALPREDARFGFARASEDAFFARPARGGALWFGLSDGVGGLRVSHGVDPAPFAARLMALAAAASRGARAPRAALAAAARALAAERIAGGATALVAHACARTGRLRAANLGDATLHVASARGDVAAAAAPRGMAAFDAPRQLGFLPAPGAPRFDAPADALDFTADVEPGGWLIAATDGLADNVFPAAAAALVRAAAARGDDAHAPARALAAAARAAARDTGTDGPFALAAKDADVAWTRGGRADDVTVLVARRIEGAPLDAAAAEQDAALVPEAAGLVPVNGAAGLDA